MKTRKMTATSLMIALTIVMMFTPLGRIPLPIVSITIAHVPAIITAIVIGLYEGVAVAAAFGLTSLYIAATAPVSLLDPFFVNPLISVFPRVLIPVVTYFSYYGIIKIFSSFKSGKYISSIISVAAGNLTNTFGVYTMLYLVYAKEIFEKSGTPAIDLIIAAISTTTLIKCIGVVIVSVPVIFVLKQTLRFDSAESGSLGKNA